jgi:hypothetical protein
VKDDIACRSELALAAAPTLSEQWFCSIRILLNFMYLQAA